MAVVNDARFSIPAVGPDNPHRTEAVIRRSRFLAQGCHCVSRADAIKFVDAIRAVNPDATHNCWAYQAGAPGDTAAIGSSDDGEPRGTAGRPMLNALLHSGIGQICVVVSRWFGGVKLGVGGLARAYQDACADNAASMPLVEAISRERWRIVCPYSRFEAVKRCLAGLEATIEEETFGADAAIIAGVPISNASVLAFGVANASNGSARLFNLDAKTVI